MNAKLQLRNFLVEQISQWINPMKVSIEKKENHRIVTIQMRIPDEWRSAICRRHWITAEELIKTLHAGVNICNDEITEI